MSLKTTKNDLQDLESVPTSPAKSEQKNSKLGKNEPIVVRPIISSRNSIVSNGSFSNRLAKSRSNSVVPNEKNKSLESLKEDQKSVKSLISRDREIAGFRQQFLILSWKNLILSKRSLCGLITEIVVPILTVFILLVLRYFVDATQYTDQSNAPYNVLDLFPITTNTSNTTMLLYYPNNVFIRGIVNQTVSLIKLRKPFFNVTCNLNTYF